MSAMRLKFAFEPTIGGVWGDEPIGDTNDMVCVRVADFDDIASRVSTAKLTTRNIPPSEQRGRVLQRGDLLLEKSGGGEQTAVGRTVLFDHKFKAVCSNFVALLRPHKTHEPRFLAYLSRAIYLAGGSIPHIKQTTGIQNLDCSSYLNQSVEIPEIAIQRQIAAYLDEQTGKIDRLMDMRQRQMALLREQRAALIQQAVTRGLNPNAPMKDSSLPWLGEVPAHWALKKLKLLCSTTKGFAFKSELFVDEGVPVVRASEIKNFSVVDCSTFIQSDIALNYPQVTLHSGDILISTVGSKAEILDSAVGQVGIVPPELDGALLNQNTARLELARPNEVSQNFIFNILRTDTFRKHLDIHAHGTANQASLSLVDILSFLAPLPPLAEQISIIEFIDCQCQRIDRTVEGYARQLEVLTEYRVALIHECVTGQRVAGVVAAGADSGFSPCSTRTATMGSGFLPRSPRAATSANTGTAQV